MEIEKMNEQQIIEYLRSKSTSSKALGVAKSRTVEDFFIEHNITTRCPNCLSPKKVKNGTNDSGITRYKCKDCGKGYSIVTNTIFEGSSYSVDEVINAYEGESTDIIFNHSKFFRSIGTTRLNELAKLYGVYDRRETKADRIRRLSDLPEADDIIFNEIAIERYGSVEDMKNAFNKLPEKRKRGRPKKTA